MTKNYDAVCHARSAHTDLKCNLMEHNQELIVYTLIISRKIMTITQAFLSADSQNRNGVFTE
jgi:hypothetical protein